MLAVTPAIGVRRLAGHVQRDAASREQLADELSDQRHCSNSVRIRLRDATTGSMPQLMPGKFISLCGSARPQKPIATFLPSRKSHLERREVQAASPSHAFFLQSPA